jgi:hypothetical protein
MHCVIHNSHSKQKSKQATSQQASSINGTNNMLVNYIFLVSYAVISAVLFGGSLQWEGDRRNTPLQYAAMPTANHNAQPLISSSALLIGVGVRQAIQQAKQVVFSEQVSSDTKQASSIYRLCI